MMKMILIKIMDIQITEKIIKIKMMEVNKNNGDDKIIV